MNRKKLTALALALLLTLSLAPAASALDTLLPPEWDEVSGLGFSLRDMIDVNKGHIDLAGSSFQLENIIFLEDAVLNEEDEFCLCETNENAMIVDAAALPPGMEADVRRETLRIPDGKDGTQVAEDIRREQAGLDPAEEPALDPAEQNRETWYLYLTGKPTQAGEYLFILWDGSIRLCSVTVLPYRPEPTPTPAPTPEESWVDPGTYTEEWADTSTPLEPYTEWTDPFTPAGQDDGGQSGLYAGDNEYYDGTPHGSDVTEGWTDTTIPAVFDDIFGSLIQTPTPTPYVPTPTPYVPTPTPYVPTPTPYVPTPTPYVPTPTPVPVLYAPSVVIAGNNQCYVDDSAVLEARVSGGYNLSYQWYTNLGYYVAPLQGATSAQYRPDTSHAGTWSFFCRVTDSAYGQQVYTDSETVSFTVSERPVVNKPISSVSVAKLPDKVDYYDGDAVDAAGLQLRVRYNDGSYDTVDTGFVVTTSTVSYNSSGLANVNVNYKGYQTSYQVKVHSYAELVRGIGVLTMPNKSSYTVGEYLDTTGLSIRVYSYDGRYLDVGEGFECSPTRFNSAGNQTVTVSFMGKTCTFTVAVQESRRVLGLTIQSLPANRSYTVGDTISTAGLVLQLQTSSGYETITSGFSISPRVATTAGSQQITVNYEGLSTSYTVDVRSNIPYATPTPTPTPFGMTPSPVPFGQVSPSPAVQSASPSPTATPIHTPTPARRNTGVSTLVKVLFGVAVVALGGLVGYVLYLRRQDMADEDFLDEASPSEKLHRIFKRRK